MTMESEIAIKFGNRVKELRKTKKLSQRGLAVKTGLNHNYIGIIERAEKSISLKNISKIACALEIEITDLFC